MVSSPPSTVGSQSATDVDETTALLAVPKTDPSNSPDEAALLRDTKSKGANQEDDDDKPLPFGQIMILCYARVVEPIAFFSIFPFINKMIWCVSASLRLSFVRRCYISSYAKSDQGDRRAQ